MKFIAGLFRKIINCPHSDHVVYKDTCEATHEGITRRIDDLSSHIDQQFDFMSNLIKNNGNGHK